MNWQNKLIEAIENNDPKKIKQFNAEQLKRVSWRGWHAFNYACEFGSYTLIKQIIKQLGPYAKAEVSTINSEWNTTRLYDVCKNNTLIHHNHDYSKTIKLILKTLGSKAGEFAAKPNCQIGTTPLHLACACASKVGVESIRLLLKVMGPTAKEIILKPISFHETPLHNVCKSYAGEPLDAESVKLILFTLGDKASELISTPETLTGQTPLYSVLSNDYFDYEIAKLMMVLLGSDARYIINTYKDYLSEERLFLIEQLLTEVEFERLTNLHRYQKHQIPISCMIRSQLTNKIFHVDLCTALQFKKEISTIHNQYLHQQSIFISSYKKIQEAMIEKSTYEFNQQDYPKAIDSFNTALSIDNTQPEIWRAIGKILVEHNCVEEAKKCFNYVLSVSPFDQEATEALQKILCSNQKSLKGHEKYVYALATLTNDLVISSGMDQTIRLWDLDCGKCLKILEENKSPIYTFAILSNGMVVGGSEDNKLLVWDIDFDHAIKKLEGHTGAINALAVLPNGHVVSASCDNTIRIWDIEQSKSIKILDGHTNWIMALSTLPNGQIVSSGYDGTIRVWDVAQGKCIQVIQSKSAIIYALIVLNNGQIVSGSDDGKLCVWNLTQKHCIQELRGHTSKINVLMKLKNDLIVSGSEDNKIRVWDMHSGACIKIFEGHTDWIQTLTTLKNGHIVSGSWDKTLREWILPSTDLFPLTTLVNQQDFGILRQTFMKENIWHVSYLSE